jgi:alkylated DNA repair dioxygenase AlkB
MIEDLTSILNIITEEEELKLLDRIEKDVNLKKDAKRSRLYVRYGKSVYDTNVMSKIIPDYLIQLSEVLVNKKIINKLPASITINIYEEGDFISPHIDDIKAGPVITILSIGSEAELILTDGSAKKNILLPRRSVFQLKGVYRTKWEHSILPVKTKRISIVFREYGN